MTINRLFLSIALGAFLLSPLGANALTVSPSSQMLKAKPGETIQVATKLSNETTGPIELTPSAGVFIPEPGNESGQAQLLPVTSGSAAEWVSFDEQRISLAPGESTTVAARISVPKDATGGQYNITLDWTQGGTAELDGPGVAAKQQISSLVLLDVDGPGRIAKADLVSFMTTGNTQKYEKLPVPFEVRVANTGNTPVKPMGSIDIYDMFGRMVASLPVNQDQKNVGYAAPNSVRKYEATWAEGFAFGKYTAKANMSMGTAGEKMSSYEFWVLPTGLLVLWLIIAAVIVVILGMLVKNMMSSVRK